MKCRVGKNVGPLQCLLPVATDMLLATLKRICACTQYLYTCREIGEEKYSLSPAAFIKFILIRKLEMCTRKVQDRQGLPVELNYIK